MELPPWASDLRPLQKVALRQITHQFKKYDVVVVGAPTGSGKSLLGYLAHKELAKKSLYICHSKGLQSQFLRDFTDSVVLMGRSNYPTALFPEQFNDMQQLSCGDCVATKQAPNCQWCGVKSACPYEVAKGKAVAAELAVINSSYFLTEANGPAHMSGRPLAIWDECDTAEKDLMGFVEVMVPKYLELGKPKKVTRSDSWLEWLEESLPKVKAMRDRLSQDKADLKVLRRYRSVKQTCEDMGGIIAELKSGENEWIMQVDNMERVQFKPVKVAGFGKDMIWRHADKWLLMSASVISAQVMLDSLGYDKEFGVIDLPSSFPVENRRIVPMPVANMTYKTKDAEFPKLMEKIKEIVGKHKGERVLVHSVSYELTDKIVKGLEGVVEKRKLVTYKAAKDREGALSRYLKTEGAVMVAPSMDRGVDLPGEMCRVQVVVKVPYPSMGDKQIARRAYTQGGREWYATETIRTLIQMTGRAVRSQEDWAISYILDSQFVKLMKENKGLVPAWWGKAVTWRV